MIIIPEQQKDDVPVDSGLAREEASVGADDPERDNDRGPAERDMSLLTRSLAMRA